MQNLNTVFDSDGDNTAQSVITQSGRLYFIESSNKNAVDVYLQFFDLKVANVTVGTTVPKLSFLVPANGAMDKTFVDCPIAFSNAITYACTTTATGGTDPAVGLALNFGYQES